MSILYNYYCSIFYQKLNGKIANVRYSCGKLKNF